MFKSHDDDERMNGRRPNYVFFSSTGYGLTQEECEDLLGVSQTFAGQGLDRFVPYMDFAKYLIRQRVYDDWPDSLDDKSEVQ